MLRTLSIRDFVIVDTLEIDFSGGFTVFTGETGAGKSILIDALALALGERGDASVVREGAAKADITAWFDGSEEALAWLAEHELASDEGGIMLRRVIDSAGRSKAFINGVTATAGQLRELGDLLVDIHGQHAHQSLMKADAQRELLDAQADLKAEILELNGLYKNWRNIAKQRSEFERDAKAMLAERERLEWQVAELEKLAPKAGEWLEVSNEHSRLSHAANLIEAAQDALNVISESDTNPVLSQINGLLLRLGKLQDVDAGLKPILEALEPARIQLQEAVYALNDYLGDVELDPERLHAVEMRIEALHTTARKLRVTPEELVGEYQRMSEQLQQLAEVSDLDALREREAAAEAAYLKLAKAIGSRRAEVAKSLASAVTTAMQDLSMAGGRFDVALQVCEPSAYGCETVEFMVAAHPGTALRPLAKVASGGELARIALAISVIASTATTTPTLIFDEVDSGIGGGVAEVVGRLLRRLGQLRQVLCVTHLPQVASQGNQHFQVSKRSVEGKTLSQIEALDNRNRIEEIARMLGGLEITATTRKHARELLAL